ncbi:excisionase family DNA-binding protein [Candidatus Neomarinimicrobiota bacterium]
MQEERKVTKMTDSNWKTVETAAAYINVSVSYLRALLRTGKIRYVRVNKARPQSRILIHETWLDEFLLENES